VSKNDTDVAHYNFDTDQPILIISCRDVAEWVCYQRVICYSISPLHYLEKQKHQKLCLFSHAVYHVSKMKWLGEK